MRLSALGVCVPPPRPAANAIARPSKKLMVVPRDRLVRRLLRARLADPRVVSYTVSDRKRKAAARADAADEAKLAPPPANDDRKPAIVIIRRKSRTAMVCDALTRMADRYAARAAEVRHLRGRSTDYTGAQFAQQSGTRPRGSITSNAPTS